MNTKIIKLDINRKLYERITAKQRDTKSRYLFFHLLDGAIPFSLANRSVRVYALKPDGTEIFNDLQVVDASKGICKLELTTQILAANGIVLMEIMVTEGLSKLTSNIFELEVGKSINSETAIISTNEFTALVNGLASLSEYDNYKNEIKNARGSAANLPVRLAGIDSQLAEIKNKIGYVEFTDMADHTKLIQNVIDNYSKIIIKKGEYNVNGEIGKCLTIPSNRVIEFEEGAKLNTLTTTHGDYRTILLQGVSNVIIKNPVLNGDKLTHTATEGEGGHGIAIYNSYNIKIYNQVSTNYWGCGLGIVQGNDILVDNIFVDNARQNGIAIVSGENITINNPTCINTSGTAPSAGIDIEPNLPTDVINNITINNLITKNNDGDGLLIMLNPFADVNKDINITINGHSDFGSFQGFEMARLVNTTGVHSGAIIINNPIYKNNKRNGIFLNNYSAIGTVPIYINNPIIYNPNENEELGGKYGNGIHFMREVGFNNTNNIGNTTILNPTIIDDRSIKKMAYGILFTDEKNGEYSDVKIVNPIKIIGTKTDHINYKIQFTKGSLFVIDNFNVCKANFNSTTQLLKRIYTQIENNGANTQTNILLENSNDKFVQRITFRNLTKFGMKISPALTHNILPISSVLGKSISTTDIGASIVLEKLSNTSWVVVSAIGNWQTEV